MKNQKAIVSSQIKIEEYEPYIRLFSFKREKLPPKILAEQDSEIYVEPSSKVGNSRVPADVLNLFRYNKITTVNKEIFDRKVDEGKLGLPAKLSDLNSEQFVEFDGWSWKKYTFGDENSYQRNRYLPSELISAKIEPYLERLEGLVGKLVPLSVVREGLAVSTETTVITQLAGGDFTITNENIEPLKRDSVFKYFRIPLPETDLNLSFDEGQTTNEGHRTAQMKLLTVTGHLGRRFNYARIIGETNIVAKIEYELKPK
jgi:hypothetical protein